MQQPGEEQGQSQALLPLSPPHPHPHPLGLTTVKENSSGQELSVPSLCPWDLAIWQALEINKTIDDFRDP